MSYPEIPRTPDGRFAPGAPGRPKGAVNKLAARVRQAILRDFEQHHQNILEGLRLEHLPSYMRVVAMALGHAGTGADFGPEDDEPLESDPTKEYLLGKARLAGKIADEKATYAEVQTFCAWEKPEPGQTEGLTPPWEVGMEIAAEAMKAGAVQNLGPQSLADLNGPDWVDDEEEEEFEDEEGETAEGAEGAEGTVRVSDAEDEHAWIEQRFKDLDERKEEERIARKRWEDGAAYRRLRGS